jgi:hypothetical protein
MRYKPKIGKGVSGGESMTYLDTKKIPKETARAVLTRAAYDVYRGYLDYAKSRGGKSASIIVENAERRLAITLASIEDWLCVVFDRCARIEEADFRFRPEARAGLGYTAPSSILKTELGDLWGEAVKVIEDYGSVVYVLGPEV